jgi:hypothetical protein
MPRKPKEFTLKKIDLDTLLQVLVGLYNSGVDYVDISGINNEEQDVIKVTVRDDYFQEPSAEYTEDIEEPITNTNTKLSDEDLNQLI